MRLGIADALVLIDQVIVVAVGRRRQPEVAQGGRRMHVAEDGTPRTSTRSTSNICPGAVSSAQARFSSAYILILIMGSVMRAPKAWCSRAHEGAVAPASRSAPEGAWHASVRRARESIAGAPLGQWTTRRSCGLCGREAREVALRRESQYCKLAPFHAITRRRHGHANSTRLPGGLPASENSPASADSYRPKNSPAASPTRPFCLATASALGTAAQAAGRTAALGARRGSRVPRALAPCAIRRVPVAKTHLLCEDEQRHRLHVLHHGVP
jgi:hypothetical protein